MLRIAYIDDNKELLDIVEDFLSMNDYEVDVYDCPVDFSHKNFDELNYDLIITDYMMPTVDGQIFISFIKEKFPHAKTIIYSGVTEEIKIEKSLEIDCFICKLDPIEKLLKTVNFLLHSEKIQRAAD